MEGSWSWIILICYGGLAHPGVIVPSPDAAENPTQSKGVVEQRTFHEPPRVPNLKSGSQERDQENNDDRYDGESREIGEFDNLDIPCQLLLEPFKAELMRDKSTFLVNVDPQGSNMHLVDLNMRKSLAEVRVRISFNNVQRFMSYSGFWLQFLPSRGVHPSGGGGAGDEPGVQ